MGRTAEDIIRERISEEEAKSKPSRSQRFDFGGTVQQLTIISLPLEYVKLNHLNHRLSAQLDDSGSLIGNPTNPENQKILQQYLSNTEKFQSLKQEILDLGQQEPGLITLDGLLVNGNTRCAALLELQKEGKLSGATIDVAVLPSSVNPREITDIEIRLQMVRLTHQDYSFTNSLLMMKKYLDSGKTEKEVAKAWNWQRGGEKKVLKRMRVLQIIEETRALSHQKLPYSFFDKKETIFLDLDDGIQTLQKSGEVTEAESLKNQRILAIFLQLNKDQIRAVDEEFIYEVYEKLSPDSTAHKAIEENIEQSPIDEDFEDDAPSKTINVRNILLSILNSENFIIDGDLNPDNELEVAKQLEDEFKSETDRLVNAERRKNRNEELHITLSSIREDIKEVRELLPHRISEKGFKISDLKYALKKANDELGKLQKQFDELS